MSSHPRRHTLLRLLYLCASPALSPLSHLSIRGAQRGVRLAGERLALIGVYWAVSTPRIYLRGRRETGEDGANQEWRAVKFQNSLINPFKLMSSWLSQPRWTGGKVSTSEVQIGPAWLTPLRLICMIDKPALGQLLERCLDSRRRWILSRAHVVYVFFIEALKTYLHIYQPPSTSDKVWHGHLCKFYCVCFTTTQHEHIARSRVLNSSHLSLAIRCCSAFQAVIVTSWKRYTVGVNISS